MKIQDFQRHMSNKSNILDYQYRMDIIMKMMFSDIASTTGCNQYLDGRLKPLLIQQHVTEAIFNSQWPETREMVHMLIIVT